MIRGNDYVPIEWANTKRTRFDIPLPEYANPGRIGVNTKRLVNMLRVGGISHLRVSGQTDGETSRVTTPIVVGHDMNGGAYAGKNIEEISVPEFTTSDEDTNGAWWRPHSATWTNAVINLNVAEMAERIKKNDKWPRGVYSTEAWANHLDTTLRNGVSDIGIKHLTVGLNKFNWYLSAFQYTVMGAVEALSPNPSVEGLMFRIPFVSGVLNTMDYFRFRNTDDGFRWSAFYGPQLDRALFLKVLSSRTNLVRATNDDY